MMRILHEIAALFTAILFFIKQKCTITGASLTKRRSLVPSPCSYGDTPLMATPLKSDDCFVCARASCHYDECGQPKYKRDPDISIDNESIGQHPHG